MSLQQFIHKPQGLVGVIIFCLCMMSFMGMGKHIHLADQHMGDELHSHHAETHSFHLHTNQHDNIDSGDIEVLHASDTQQVDIEADSQFNKLVKIIVLFCLSLTLLVSLYIIVSVIRSVYISPLRPRFEIFHSLLRGPPTV